mmetsp:Transcript_59765/g.129532  ORF Transcript_59765/g.129532 Transcript_59765/m.129532 type:complete len:240 (+) Transcript_59765:831-1550(+)
MAAHLERAHEGRRGDPLVPRQRTFASQRGHGHQGQDLGRLQHSQVHADVHGPRCGGSRHPVQQRRLPLRHVLLRSLSEAVGHGDRRVHLRLHQSQAAVLRLLQPGQRQAERDPGRLLKQAHCAVRHQHRQGGTGVRPAPRRGEHHHLLRGEPPLRHHGRRQEDAHLGVRDPDPDQAHRRPDAPLDAGGDEDAESKVAPLPEPRQPDHLLHCAGPLQAQSQEGVQGARHRRIRVQAWRLS